MNTNETVLVLGASGGIGGEVCRQLRDGGWTVRALKRGAPLATDQRDGVTWLRGDALVLEDVLAAAEGCSVIVHAVNPPGYRNWTRDVLPMLDNTIAAAIQENATIVLPGTLYNYGPDAPALLTEDTPQTAATRKGRVRIAMEERLRQATERGARVLIVRAGDYFGPRMGGSWFGQAMIKPHQPVRSISYPGRRGVGHEWAYLPDVARTMVELLRLRGSLEPFAAFHMAGQWDEDGTLMTGAIRRVVLQRSRTSPVVRRFPWWLVLMLSPIVTMFREMLEMRYIWQIPLQLDNANLVATLGYEPHTPLDQAVECTLIGMGCLAEDARVESKKLAQVLA